MIRNLFHKHVRSVLRIWKKKEGVDDRHTDGYAGNVDNRHI